MRRALAVTAALLLGGVTWAAATPAAAPAAADDTADFEFSSFAAEYTLGRAADGSSTLRTVETLVAEFPDRDQNRGIVRAIPLRFEGADLEVRVESVTDADGDAVPYEENEDDGFLEVATGTDAYVRGTQTYVITYDRANITRSYDDTGADELYLDTNGTGWQQPFEEVSATVRVEPELVDALTGDYACYAGEEGSTRQFPIEREEEDGAVAFSSTVAFLGPGENVTLAIGFERGTFTEPERPRDSAAASVVPAAVGGLGLLALLGAVLVRRIAWRDAPARGTRVVQYTRPPGIDLLEAGALLRRTSPAPAAMIVDLAVRGVIRVVDGGDGASTGRYSLELLEMDGLPHADRDAVQAVFGPGVSVGARRTLGGDGASEVGPRMREQVRAAGRRLVDDGLETRVTSRSRLPLVVVGIAVILVAVVALVVLASLSALVLWSALLLAATIVVGIAVLMVSSKRRSTTPAGAEVREHLNGLRDYLQLAEARRFEVLQSPEGAERERVDPADPRQVVRLEEALLPFAVLFGIEKGWAQQLEQRYTRAGTSAGWYTGGAFDSTRLALLMASSNRTTGGSASWAGSGASGGFGGSTGGGFSGGGAGGGGGGGR